MSLSTQPEAPRKTLVLPPDGRQTRIDFFNAPVRKRDDRHVVAARKQGRGIWDALTGWMKASKQEQDRQIEKYREFLASRSYSEKTVKRYLYMLQKFFNYLDERRFSELSLGVIEDYNYDFFVSGRYSRSYQLQFINSLTLYLEFSEGVKVNLKGLRKSTLPKVR